jgi:hypothetical protein
MNNEKKWTKLIMVALLVALASFSTAGLVFADHFPPVTVVGSMSSLSSFQQYQAALDHSERAYQAAFAALPARVIASSSASLLPYPDELDRSELDRRDTVITKVSGAASYIPYADEFDRMELHGLAAQSKAGDDSRARWEQYLKFAEE